MCDDDATTAGLAVRNAIDADAAVLVAKFLAREDIMLKFWEVQSTRQGRDEGEVAWWWW